MLKTQLLLLAAFSSAASITAAAVLDSARAQCPSQCVCELTADSSYYLCNVNGKEIVMVINRNGNMENKSCGFYMEYEGFTDTVCSDLPLPTDYTIAVKFIENCSPAVQCYHRSQDFPEELKIKMLLVQDDEEDNYTVLGESDIVLINNLSTLEESASYAKKLKIFALKGAKSLTRNLTGQFSGGHFLQTIYSFRLNPSSVQNQTFAKLISAETVEISSSGLRALAAHALAAAASLETVAFTHNDIRYIPARLLADPVELKTLILSDNGIKEMPEGLFKNLTSLEALNLDRNHLEVLRSYFFADLKNLKYLSLDNNFLTTISDAVFRANLKLETLSIASNKLTLKSDQLTGQLQPVSPFHMLRALKRLLLEGNALNTTFSDWRVNLTRLKNLSLSHNQFTELELEDVQFEAINITVDLQYNHINTIRLPYASDEYPPSTFTSTVVRLNHNQFMCDCGIYALVLRLNGIHTLSPEPKFDIEDSKCISPAELQGHYIKHLVPSAFRCDLPLTECPVNCSSCTWSIPSNKLQLECSATPDTLPKSSNDVTLTLHNLTTPVSNLNVQILKLIGLGLRNNDIDELKLPKTVQVLDLTNNSLHIPPIPFINANISLYLSKNPFICECQYYEQLSALQESRLVLDYEELRCNNGEKIKVDKLCGVWTSPVVVAGVTFIIIASLAAVSSIFCYIYSNEIIVFLMHKGICTSYFEDEDSDKEYDVFVSFSHKDLAFIQDDLIPKLEVELKLKTCIHYRDWNVGEFITTQITRSVESSRKTIIVMTKDFLNSMWATVEFNVAHTLALRESKARVILILLEDVSEHPRLPEEIRAYISTNTYLMWGDSKFWDKLQRALPERKKKFVWRNTRASFVNSSEHQQLEQMELRAPTN